MKKRWSHRGVRRSITTEIGMVLSVALVLSVSAPTVGHAFTIRGSTTVLPIAQSAAEVFMDRNEGADISVQGGGSGVGIASLMDGTCDVACSSRTMKEDEIARGRSKGMEFQGHVIAMDGIALIVHPKNPVTAVAKGQIKRIYGGQISNWLGVGGTGQPIVVVSRDTASGTFEAFMELVLDQEKVRPDALMQASNQAVAMAVATSPGAIGYVGLGYLSSKVKPLVVDGVLPSRDTVQHKAYPLSRPLYLYTNGAPRGAVKEFLAFIMSDEGQRLVEELGFVGIR